MSTDSRQKQKFAPRMGAFLVLHLVLWALIAAAVSSAQQAPGTILAPLALFSLGVISFNYAGALATFFVAVLCKQSSVDFKSDARTLKASRAVVSVPCLLSSRQAIDALLDTVVAHYRSSGDSAAAIVLLGDYVDASRLDDARTNEDSILLDHATQGIDRLNREVSNVFVLLVRDRVWAASEQVWMGHERKRGKIEAFNRYLLNPLDCEFSVLCGDVSNLRDVSYVLTLDADTVLPDNALRSLVAKMDDPSNADFVMIQPAIRRARFEPRNLYQWMTTSPFPPLSILQSVFGRSKFVGKGIYDVRRFHEQLLGRVPSGWVLSHDVMESALVPVGSTDEVFVRDANPESFEEACGRLHRWYRGDWQNIPWGMPSVLRYAIPEFRSLTRSKVDLAGAWMVHDLLIRDLHAPALMFLLWVGCLAEPTMNLLFGLLGCEAALIFMTYMSKRTRAEEEGSSVDWIQLPLRQIFFLLSMPAIAWICLDAALRSAWRMFVSGRHRLQWTASAEFRSQVTQTKFRYWTFVPSSVLGLALAVPSLFAASAAGLVLSVAWMIFPVIVTGLESAAVVRDYKAMKNTKAPGARML